MDITKFIEAVFIGLAGVGGFGGIVIFVAKYISDMLAERISMKYQLILDKEKEQYKTQLSKKEYISKTRFDTEFIIYRELIGCFSEMVNCANLLIPAGYVEFPADKEEKEKADLDYFKSLESAYIKAQNSLHSNEAFISGSISESCKSFLHLVSLQMRAYTRRFLIAYHGDDKYCFTSKEYDRTKEINNNWDTFINDVRSYLSSLEVLE